MSGVFEAFGVGLAAQSSLLMAGVIVCWVKGPIKVVGILAGFGAGAMVATIAFDLVRESGRLGSWDLGGGTATGVAISMAGDRLVEKKFGDQGKVAPWASWSARWSTACPSQ